MTTESQTYLNPEVLDRVAGLELKARLIVEGYVSGLHRSPFKGFSVEFAEHREYVPGDDMRFLDWKVFGKTDRLYIKRYEEETNLESQLVVDASESMAYTDRENKLPSKFAYASWAAGALAYLITKQQDSAGLVLFDEEVRTVLPALSNASHLHHLLRTLEGAEPAKGTGVGRALAAVAESFKRRGLVVLFSDLMDDPDDVLKGLTKIRHRGHEVLLFHILAQDELTFPFQRLARFEGMEDLPALIADPVSIRKAYLEEVEAFRKRLRRVCLANQIDLVELHNRQSLGVVLAAYLAKREARRRG